MKADPPTRRRQRARRRRRRRAGRWGRSPTRSSRRSRALARRRSSSSTRTSTSSRYCAMPSAVARGRRELGGGRGTGLPSGRLPDRGVDRPPFPDEVQHARRYANADAPGDHAGDAADRQTHPGRSLRRPRVRTGPRRAGSRSAGEHAPVAGHPAGACSDRGAARRADHRHVRVDGRLRIRARTDRVDHHRRTAPDRRPLRDRTVRQQRRAARRRHQAAGARPRDPHRWRHRIRGRRDRARLRPARDDQPTPAPLRLRPLRRWLVGHHEPASSGSAELAELGVPTIHLSIGIAPLSVECERITVITDPAQALDHVAADTVAALTARQRRPLGR